MSGRALLQEFTDNASYLQKIWDSSGWFLVHMDVIGAVGMECGVFLSCLINIHGMKIKEKRKKKEPPNAWFRCSIQTLENRLRLNQAAQRRLINLLKKKGVLQSRLQGLPSKRWLFIDYEKIAELITNYQ